MLTKIMAFALFGLLCSVATIDAASKTMCDSGCDYSNLQAACAGMSQGDTLTISDGTYTGTSNRFTATVLPPAGAGTGTGDARFTIVKAQTPGGVIIGDGTANVFYLDSYGGLPQYLKFEGIIFKGLSHGVRINNGYSIHFTTGDLASGLSVYWYFKGCGFHDSDGDEEGTITINYVKNLIFEDCFSWGRSRYGINTYIMDDLVMRRHIDRRDAVQRSSSCPVSNYANYANHHALYQNIVALDTNDSYWESTMGSYAGFYSRQNYNNRLTHEITIQGGMFINMDVSNSSHSGGSGCWGESWAGVLFMQDSTNNAAYNTMFWKASNGINGYQISNQAIVDHITYGNGGYNLSGIYNYSFGDSSYSNLLVTNSNCFASSSQTMGSMSGSSTYNNDYNCGGSFSGTNITTANTAYQYAFKPESSFPDGNDGQKKGAKILYKYGVDGTFYGETGYNAAQPEVAANKLWPWGRVYTGDNTWEKKIWATMRANYDPSDETRGFAQSNQSITNWVATGAGTITPTNALEVDGAGGTNLVNVDRYVYEDASVGTISNITIGPGVSLR